MRASRRSSTLKLCTTIPSKSQRGITVMPKFENLIPQVSALQNVACVKYLNILLTYHHAKEMPDVRRKEV